MSGRGGHRRGYNSRKEKKTFVGKEGKEVLKDIDDNNPTIKAFQQYAAEIDEKHDRHERLVKISRDITIESKRIIFLLHNVDKEHKREEILKEADTRLKKLITTNFRNIAIELENQDTFQYLRAYSPGVQEFIEALTFYQYLQENKIQHWQHIVDQFTYEIEPEGVTSSVSTEVTSTSTEETPKTKTKILKTPLPASEFVLGIADLTGELMRKCINSLGSGNIDDCFTTCSFVKSMYMGFLKVGNVSSREVSRKVYVLKQSLNKMEHVCYNIVVRGSEVPKHMLANIIPTNPDVGSDEDEGFFM